MTHTEFHLATFPANKVWPHGGWSVYKIAADEIAKRIRTDERGNITERHSWSGFLGCYETLDEAHQACKDALAEIINLEAIHIHK